MQQHDFTLFADFFLFYLQDEGQESILDDVWTPEAEQRMLATDTGTIGVRTTRNMDVPVTVIVGDAEPITDLAEWDRSTSAAWT
jgi:hypothetical protein